MSNKTKKFDLNGLIIFKNELIYFFYINPYKSSINISLEINGKTHNFNDFQNIKLNEIINKNENEEVNFKVKDELELVFTIKIIEKFNKKEIFESFHEQLRESKITWNKKKKYDKKIIETGISIQERVKIFSGKEKENNIKNINQKKPGKLKLPTMFQKSINNSENKNNTKYKKNNISKKEMKNNNETENIIKGKINKNLNNNNEKIEKEMKSDRIKIEDKNNFEQVNKKEGKYNDNEYFYDKIYLYDNNNKEIKNDIKDKVEDNYDFKTILNINEKTDKINDDKNNDLDDLYEEREYLSEEEGKSLDEIENSNYKEEDKNIEILNEEKNNKKENQEINDKKDLKIIDDKNKINEGDEIVKISEELKEINNKQDKSYIKINNEQKNTINIQKEIEKPQNKNVLKMASTISYHPKIKGSPSFKSSLGDIFLESQNYSSYLKTLQQKGIKESKRETFCEGFFIASFPFKNPSVI